MRTPVRISSLPLKVVLFTVLNVLVVWTGTAVAGSFDLSVENAYRRDSLDWNIAGYTHMGQYVNVLSELTWDDVEIYQLSAEGLYRFGRQPDAKVAGSLKGRAAYGWIFAGENQDSDYLGNNRTDEFSRSNNNADDGHTIDLLAGGGVRFAWLQGRLSLTPLVGLSYHQQKLTISNGYQSIPALGPFPGLDSSYTAEWFGPWIGADFEWQVIPRLVLGTGLELHAVQYDGEGNWNLRDDLQHPRSFKHDGEGVGAVLVLKGEYQLVQNLALGLQGRLEDWQVEDGDDTIFFADGTIVQTPLNEVNHTAATIGLNLIFSF